METNTPLFSNIMTGITKKSENSNSMPRRPIKIIPTNLPTGPSRSLFSILSTIIAQD